MFSDRQNFPTFQLAISLATQSCPFVALCVVGGKTPTFQGAILGQKGTNAELQQGTLRFSTVLFIVKPTPHRYGAKLEMEGVLYSPSLRRHKMEMEGVPTRNTQESCNPPASIGSSHRMQVQFAHELNIQRGNRLRVNDTIRYDMRDFIGRCICRR